MNEHGCIPIEAYLEKNSQRPWFGAPELDVWSVA